MTRDTQRQRLYDAERSLSEWRTDAPMPWPAVEEHFAKINAAVWFRARWRVRPYPVQKRGGSAYCYSGGRITLPLFARRALPILHEIAHAVTAEDCTGHASHGPEFCAHYLALVRHFLGADVATRLRAAMRTQKVRVAATSTVPGARYTARPVAAIRQARTAAARRPLSDTQLREVAALLRQAAAAGQLGPSGRAARTHALTVARALDPDATARAASRSSR